MYFLVCRESRRVVKRYETIRALLIDIRDGVIFFHE
jgi:hypothetical protein